MTLHQVAAEAAAEGGGPLQVDGVAGPQVAELVRPSVSGTASAAHQPGPRLTTVRQQPLTAMESPICVPSVTVAAEKTSRRP